MAAIGWRGSECAGFGMETMWVWQCVGSGGVLVRPGKSESYVADVRNPANLPQLGSRYAGIRTHGCGNGLGGKEGMYALSQTFEGIL